MHRKILAAVCGAAAALTPLACAKPHMEGARVSRAPFGFMPTGEAVELFTLTNTHGVEVRAMSYGGTIISLKTPDSRGRTGDIVLGYDSLAPYLAKSPYFGAIVGRYANRIAHAWFSLEHQTVRLVANDGRNSLHGGARGFDKVVWAGAPVQSDSGVGVTFTYTSPDGDQGYPGTLNARVRYLLTDRNELIVDYFATTDKPTVVNLTHHSYFNLAGEGDITGHVLTIDADRYTPVDETLIPTGALASVQGTPFDFRRPTPIGERIGNHNEQLLRGRGYDHNWVLNRPAGGAALVHAARLVAPASGRTLDIATTEPGIQFYSGNFLDGTITGKAGRVYGHRTGLCLETQHFPDSPNQRAFPSTELKPGQEYRSRTVYTFGTDAKR